MNNRIHESTKLKYEAKVRHCIEYFRKKAPQYCIINEAGNEDLDWALLCNSDEGTLKMREFYAHISKKQANVKTRKPDEDHSYIDPVMSQSFQHVSCYKSAIINRIRERRVRASDDFLRDQENFVRSGPDYC